MGLETGTYISDLVVTNPLGSDNKSQGDDHIRLIKQVIKNTFPNIDGPVTLTQTQINNLLNAGNEEFVENGQFIPSGVIVMWSGTVTNIPSGWSLCDGTGGTPNLGDRFIAGATVDAGGTLGGIDSTGGTNSNHNHTCTVAGTTLTEAQMPAHHHLMFVDGSEPIGGLDQASDYVSSQGSSGTSNKYILADSANVANVGRTKSTGSGDSHTHTATNTSASHLPAYYQLAFIMKD